MSKENKMYEVYGGRYDWDENGWLLYGCDEETESGFEPFGEYETRNHIDGYYEWRPIELRNIENNNGWEDIQKAELINGQLYEIGVTWLSLENYKEKFVHQGFAEFKQNGFFDESGYFIKPTPNRVKLINVSEPPLY